MPTRPRARARVLAALACALACALNLARASDVSFTADARRRGGEEISFPLEHSLDGVAFVHAGVVTGKLAVDRNDARNFRLSAPKATREPLDASAAAALNALAASGGAYRLRAPSNFASGRPGSYVMASLPARCVLAANLADALTVHADDRGNAYGIEYAAANGECDARDEAATTKRASAGSKFRTTVYVRVGKDAPGLNPDAPTDVRGHGSPATDRSKREAEQRRKAREGGDGKSDGAKEIPTQMTFFQRHWLKIMFSSYVFAFLCAPAETRDTRAAAQRRVNAATKKRQ